MWQLKDHQTPRFGYVSFTYKYYKIYVKWTKLSNKNNSNIIAIYLSNCTTVSQQNVKAYVNPVTDFSYPVVLTQNSHPKKINIMEFKKH